MARYTTSLDPIGLLVICECYRSIHAYLNMSYTSDASYYQCLHFYLGETENDYYNLELVQVLIRHGDRAAIHTMPNYRAPSIPCNSLPEDSPGHAMYLNLTKSLAGAKVNVTNQIHVHVCWAAHFTH